MSAPHFARAEVDGWSVVDVEQRYLARDGVYWLPPPEARRDLKPGTLVKLVFVWATPAPEGPGRERMWVEVAFEQDGAFHGHLANTPFHPVPPLKEGAGLWFRPEHVVDVLREGEKALSTTSKVVQCKGHGASEACYACEHLTTSATGLGFYTSDSAGLRPDAWCGSCDQLLAKHGSWDAVEPHPRIKLVCGGCYDAFRERNSAPVA